MRHRNTIAKQRNTTTLRHSTIAKPPVITKKEITRQPLTTRTRHRDTYIMQPITQRKRRNCMPSTTDIKRWRRANEPKLKINSGLEEAGFFRAKEPATPFQLN